MPPDNGFDTFLKRVRELGPFADGGQVGEAVEVTLELLGEGLSGAERAGLSRELPAPLGTYLGRSKRERRLALPAFYEHVAERLFDVTRGIAIEQAQIVGRVLAEWLTPESLRRLHGALPEFAELLTPGEEPEPVAVAGTGKRAGRRTSLAEGRPGSSHPLASARPPQAHTESIARSDDPHGDTKLSGSQGLTQEREGETLARGRPGPKRPISG